MAASSLPARSPLSPHLKGCKPPHRLPKKLKAAWWAYVDGPVGPLLVEADMHLVDRYFLLLARLEKLEGQVEDLGEEVWQTRKDGTASRHGILMEVNRVEREVGNLRKELGITPQSRVRLGADLASAELTVRQANRLDPQQHGSNAAGLLDRVR